MTGSALPKALERISHQGDVSWIVAELNLQNKKKNEQIKRINQIENEMAAEGYEHREFSDRKRDGVYHLHFVRGNPNA